MWLHSEIRWMLGYITVHLSSPPALPPPAGTHGDGWIKGFLQTLRTEAVVGERGVGGNKIHSAWPALLSLIYFCGYT